MEILRTRADPTSDAFARNDAAHAVLCRPAAGFSGHFLIDDEVLSQSGVDDLSGYAVDPSRPLLPDLFLD